MLACLSLKAVWTSSGKPNIGLPDLPLERRGLGQWILFISQKGLHCPIELAGISSRNLKNHCPCSPFKTTSALGGQSCMPMHGNTAVF